MSRIGTARRVILSVFVPLLAVAGIYPLEFHSNERAASSEGLAGAMVVAMKGPNATVFDTYAPRDQWWFWPAIVGFTIAWLWALWPPAQPPERAA